MPEFIYKPFKQSYSSFGLVNTKRRENNALKQYKENRIFTTVNNLSFIEGFKVPRVKYDAYDSNLVNNSKTSYQNKNQSVTKFKINSNRRNIQTEYLFIKSTIFRWKAFIFQIRY